MTTIYPDPLDVVICGVGGQGNVLISSLIASALNRKGYYVTVGDTYGAAQRGGAVFSSVRISSRRSYGPFIPEGRAHLIVGLEPLETLRLLQRYGNPNALCITNTYTVYPVGVMANRLEYPDEGKLKKAIESLSRSAWFIDATDIALKLGAQIALNVVMAGALIGSGQIPLTKEEAESEMRDFFSPKSLDLNFKAFEMGMTAMKMDA